MLSAFEGDKGESKTMLPVIREFMKAHQLPDVTVVADAGMISGANMKAMSKSDLHARPVYHRKRDSIEAPNLSQLRAGSHTDEQPCDAADLHEQPGRDEPEVTN